MIDLTWDPEVRETESALQAALAKHQHIRVTGPGWVQEFHPQRVDYWPGASPDALVYARFTTRDGVQTMDVVQFLAD